MRRRHGLSTLIVCVSPTAAAAPETLSTLNFASRARRTVHTHPRLKLVDESREAGGAWRTLASRGGPWRTLRRERRGSALVVPPRVLGSSSTARRAAGATRAA